MFVLILICFSLPIIFTSEFSARVNSTASEAQNTEIVQNNITQATYDYDEYNTIKLLHKDENKIEEIDLEEYLYGVVSAEMPASFEEEALKAQAVVARTYTIYKIVNNDGKHGEADICDDSTCCQAWISKEDRQERWEEDKREEYWNKIVACVNETTGEIITYEGEPINAFFHANSGGSTETPLNVWGGSGYPYLQTVTTAGEDAYSQYQSEAEFTLDQFEGLIREIHPDFEIDFARKRLHSNFREDRRQSSKRN